MLVTTECEQVLTSLKVHEENPAKPHRSEVGNILLPFAGADVGKNDWWGCDLRARSAGRSFFYAN